MASIKENVQALNQEILNGNILGAFEQFYAEHCVMQENDQQPREGKDANREYEKGFVDAVEQWHNAQVLSVNTDEEAGTSAVEWLFDFSLKGGPRVQRKQVAVQRWEGDKIVQENFYFSGS